MRGYVAVVLSCLTAFVVGFGVSRAIRPDEAPPPQEDDPARTPGAARAAPQRAFRAMGSAVPSRDAPLRLDGDSAADYVDERAGSDASSGARTRAVIERAVERFYVELLETRGPASRCADEGFLDDTIVNVRYHVVATRDRLVVSEGRVVHDDLPEMVRGCLDRYLDHSVEVRAEDSGGDFAEMDVDVLGILPTGDLRDQRVELEP